MRYITWQNAICTTQKYFANVHCIKLITGVTSGKNKGNNTDRYVLCLSFFPVISVRQSFHKKIKTGIWCYIMPCLVAFYTDIAEETTSFCSLIYGHIWRFLAPQTLLSLTLSINGFLSSFSNIFIFFTKMYGQFINIWNSYLNRKITCLFPH